MSSISHRVGIDPRQSRRSSVLVLCVPLMLGCGAEYSPAAVQGVSLTVNTDEWEPNVRYILMVGDTGHATLEAFATTNCFATNPCSTTADVTFRSSDGNVVTPARRVVRSPATVPFVGRAPGSVQVMAEAKGYSKSTRVDVVATALPVDSMHLSALGGPPWTLATSITADTRGNVVGLVLPVQGYAGLDGILFRSNQRVWLPFNAPAIQSSDTTVAGVHPHCLPRAVDPQCDRAVGFGYVTGIRPGSATIVVTVRNVQRVFQVTVR